MKRTSNRTRSAGYSLIELLVVLAIVGVLSAAYVVYSSDKSGPAVKGAMNGVFGAIVDARTMARATGQQVALSPSGTGSTAVLTYQAASGGTGSTSVSSSLTVTWTGSQGQYVHATDSAISRFCVIDMDGSSSAGSAALTSLKSSLGSTTVNSTAVFNSTAWTKSLFDASKTSFFYGNGTPNSEGNVVVVGARGGQPISNGPVGIILVNSSGNIYRYYRSSSSSSWVRL